MNTSIQSTVDRVDIVVAERIFGLLNVVRALLIGLPELDDGQIVAVTPDHVYLLLGEHGKKGLWVCDFDMIMVESTIAPLANIGDVHAWLAQGIEANRTPSEEAGVIEQSLIAWLDQPRFPIAPAKDIRQCMEHADFYISRRLEARLSEAEDKLKNLVAGGVTLEPVTEILTNLRNRMGAFNKHLNDTETCPTGDDYSELYDIVEHGLDRLLLLLIGQPVT